MARTSYPPETTVYTICTCNNGDSGAVVPDFTADASGCGVGSVVVPMSAPTSSPSPPVSFVKIMLRASVGNKAVDRYYDWIAVALDTEMPPEDLVCKRGPIDAKEMLGTWPAQAEPLRNLQLSDNVTQQPPTHRLYHAQAMIGKSECFFRDDFTHGLPSGLLSCDGYDYQCEVDHHPGRTCQTSTNVGIFPKYKCPVYN